MQGLVKGGFWWQSRAKNKNHAHFACFELHLFKAEEVQTLLNSHMTKQHSKGGTTITSYM